jgi:hypothetical protein
MSAMYGDVPPGGIQNIPFSIPSGMLYRVKQIQGVSKQTLKMFPVSGQTTASNGRKIIFALPTNSLVDLSTLEMNFTGTTQHRGNNVATNVANYVQKAYRRLSGGGKSKGTYARLPSQDEEGTYVILPTKETKTRTLGVSEDAPKSWPAMEKAKKVNERIIRESIERTDQEEIKKALLLGTNVPGVLVGQNIPEPKSRLNFSHMAIENRKKSANSIQLVFRGHQERKDYHELDKRNANANKLQRVIRGHQARKDFNEFKQSILSDAAANQTQPMVLRSGTETGSRLAAFREKHPQTVSLQGKISDAARGKSKKSPEELKQLKDQLQSAKESEGVGQAKKGRPPGAPNKKNKKYLVYYIYNVFTIWRCARGRPS